VEAIHKKKKKNPVNLFQFKPSTFEIFFLSENYILNHYPFDLIFEKLLELTKPHHPGV
jgi:hypothetical protein